MRGGGDARVGFRGVLEEEAGVVSASERSMRRRWGAEHDDGYSVSSAGGGGSSGRGSFSCDSPLAGFVRADGDPDTDLETDGLATSSSNASAAFTDPHDKEEGEEVFRGVKEEWAQAQEPAKNPAGRATGECLYQRRCRSEAVLLHGRKGLKHRPASLDFGSPGFNGTPLSPGFVVGGVGLMSKGPVSSHISSGVFPSPGTPSYLRHRSSVLGYQKGWSSERVPLPSKGNRRYPGSSMALPFNKGRTLPSKWEDAERWIFSPNSGDAVGRTSLPHAQRRKAKSGPLGPPGRLGGQYSSVSLLDSGRVGHLTANSPFLAGVLIPEHYCREKSNVGRYMSGTAGDEFSIGIVGRSSLANGGSHAVQSTRVRQRLDTAIESSASLASTQESVQDGLDQPKAICSLSHSHSSFSRQPANSSFVNNHSPTKQALNEQVEFIEDSTSVMTPMISRKDIATQTSPELSRSSSPSARLSFIRSISMQQVKERESCFSDLEVRDVQMDDRVTLTRWSKKHVTQASNKNSTNIIEWKKKTVDSKSSSWESTEAKCISKVEREEAKITAWENLQKTKAEAAIQKLVMKLEKKRSSSLDKILSTLRSAQRKAQGMHDAATASQDEQLSRKAKKTSHLTKNGQISSLSGCFICHAF